MPNILVIKEKKNIKKRQKVERELLWYDHLKGKMEKFSGGKLTFEYGYDPELDVHRLLPKVDEVFETKNSQETDEESVDNWFKIYANYNETKAFPLATSDEGVVFDVPENEVEDFTYSLERQNIEFRKI
jgi:hypothetical protein